MTFEKVAKILAEYKGIDVSEVKLDSTFEALELDSLDVAELVMSMEDEFDVTIELDAAVKTVAELVTRIDAANA